VFFAINISLAAAFVEEFDETLKIRPLRDGKVASSFSFKTLLKGAAPRNPEYLNADDAPQHYTVFPLALGQILREYAVTELHLTLNAGNWNYDQWGYPDEPGVGTGAELWAWMADGAPTTIEHRWQGLRNGLAGLFCASLGSLDEQRTTSPRLSFAPEGSLPDWDFPHHIRHASLPSEHVCTENLTPFLKLLPCKSLSGIASLLNPHRLFDADWHGMGIHVLWRQDEGVEVRLTFQMVSDPLRSSLSYQRDWSFHSIFGRKIIRTCPIAQSSHILVVLPGDQNYNLTPEPSTMGEDHATFYLDDALRSSSLDVAMQWPEEPIFQHPLAPPLVPLTAISVQRTLRGSSQSRGHLTAVITNNNPTELQIIYLETVPWLLQFYLHTLKTFCDGVARADLISVMAYTPSIPHSSPTTFQSILTLPANSTVHMIIDVTKSFLRYTEHPPDAQRGWDLPPAVLLPLHNISPAGAQAQGHGLQRFYTSALLVDLATPDFSMPYNVIIFSCSLMAFIFGSIFNLLTRNFVIVSLHGANTA